MNPCVDRLVKVCKASKALKANLIFTEASRFANTLKQLTACRIFHNYGQVSGSQENLHFNIFKKIMDVILYRELICMCNSMDMNVQLPKYVCTEGSGYICAAQWASSST